MRRAAGGAQSGRQARRPLSVRPDAGDSNIEGIFSFLFFGEGPGLSSHALPFWLQRPPAARQKIVCDRSGRLLPLAKSGLIILARFKKPSWVSLPRIVEMYRDLQAAWLLISWICRGIGRLWPSPLDLH